MDRTQFITGLRQGLGGRVPGNVLEENVKYYEEYLDIQIRQGRTEQEVLSELGDPRLLAKTIIEANRHAENAGDYEKTEEYDEEGRAASDGSFMDWYRGLPQWIRTVIKVTFSVLLVLFLIAVFRALFFPILIIVLITALVRRLR